MPTETMDQAVREAKSAKTSAEETIDHSQRAFAEALQVAERTLAEATRKAERALREGVEALRLHSRTYADTAGAQVEEAQRYVVERVKERPLTATLAGLGVGLLLGLLLSNRSK